MCFEQNVFDGLEIYFLVRFFFQETEKELVDLRRRRSRQHSGQVSKETWTEDRNASKDGFSDETEFRSTLEFVAVTTVVVAVDAV